MSATSTTSSCQMPKGLRSSKEPIGLKNAIDSPKIFQDRRGNCQVFCREWRFLIDGFHFMSHSLSWANEREANSFEMGMGMIDRFWTHKSPLLAQYRRPQKVHAVFRLGRRNRAEGFCVGLYSVRTGESLCLSSAGRSLVTADCMNEHLRSAGEVFGRKKGYSYPVIPIPIPIPILYPLSSLLLESVFETNRGHYYYYAIEFEKYLYLS